MEVLMILLFLMFVLCIYLPAAIVFNGWVLTKLWVWFLIPVFGLKPITIAQAIGVSLVISFLHPPTIPETKEKGWGAVATGIFKPFLTGLITLGIALIVKQYL